MEDVMYKRGTATRKRIYDYLVKFITNNGYSPSVREIAKGVEISSTSTIYYHLYILEKMGKIRMQPKKTRSISLVGYKFVKDEADKKSNADCFIKVR